MVDLLVDSVESVDSSRAAISWPAIIGGAVVGAAVGLLLFTLGLGFGLLTVSPWGGVSPTAFGAGAAIWLVVIEWVSAAVGGYIAGRLRTKWAAIHTHEVFFRDTAHGFITWALSTVIVFALGASSVTALIGGVTGAAATIASGAAQGASSSLPGLVAGGDGYFSDLLFRAGPSGPAATTASASPAPTTGEASAPPASATSAPAPSSTGAGQTAPAPATSPSSRTEATTILVHALSAGSLSGDDRTYLAQLVAAQTGLSTAEAQARVDAVMGQVQDAATTAKNAVDAARKAAAAASLLFALSLLIGAFVACVAAAIGGKERDEADQVLGTVIE